MLSFPGNNNNARDRQVPVNPIIKEKVTSLSFLFIGIIRISYNNITTNF